MYDICTKFRENILISSDYGADKISVLIITKENNSVKLYMELQFFVFAYRLIMVYIFIQFRKNIKQFQSYGADTLSILFITKVYNSLIILPGVTDLVLCTSSNHCLHLYHVPGKYFERFQSYGAGTISILLQRCIIP